MSHLVQASHVHNISSDILYCSSVQMSNSNTDTDKHINEIDCTCHRRSMSLLQHESRNATVLL